MCKNFTFNLMRLKPCINIPEEVMVLQTALFTEELALANMQSVSGHQWPATTSRAMASSGQQRPVVASNGQ